MRRFLLVCICMLTLLGLTLPVSAQSQVNQMTVHGVVSPQGDCQMTATVTLHVDQPPEALTFPVPKNASNISLNGSWARTKTTESVKEVDLVYGLGNFVGDVSFTLTYNLSDQVSKNPEELLELTVPLMSGFAYPTESIEFTVTLPGNFPGKPGFSSGYHQANIEQNLSYTVEGAVLTGRSQKPLKDHETLKMILPVTETMFPQTQIVAPDLIEIQISMIISALTALIFWVIFLRCPLPWGPCRPTPPEGYSAGELHSILDLQGADLTLMIFTWAQLGYVILEPCRGNRVKIYKQMNMGNERSRFERKCFALLFGKRQMVDSSSLRYSELWLRIYKSAPHLPYLLRKRSGSRKFFRILCAAVGLFSGAYLGILLGTESEVSMPVVVSLGVAGFLISYIMQPWVPALFSSGKFRLWLTLALTALWVVPAALLQDPIPGLTGAGSGLIGGILLFLGGRRTEAGLQAMDQVAGLYRYLTCGEPEYTQHIWYKRLQAFLISIFKPDRKHLQQTCRENPQFFFDLAPYAMALGADKRFAKRFGSARLPSCPYIHTGKPQELSAPQWAKLMRKLAGAMDAGRRRAPLEHFSRILRSASAPPPKRRPRR